jgi:hypothetical protein
MVPLGWGISAYTTYIRGFYYYVLFATCFGFMTIFKYTEDKNSLIISSGLQV